jgi:adenylosuccinate lyase
MKSNIDRTYGVIFSQRLLLMLIDKGLSREAASDRVQPLAMQAWTDKVPLRELIETRSDIPTHLSNDDLDAAFDPSHHLAQVDAIFKRVGLDSP